MVMTVKMAVFESGKSLLQSQKEGEGKIEIGRLAMRQRERERKKTERRRDRDTDTAWGQRQISDLVVLLFVVVHIDDDDDNNEDSDDDDDWLWICRWLSFVVSNLNTTTMGTNCEAEEIMCSPKQPGNVRERKAQKKTEGHTQKMRVIESF